LTKHKKGLIEELKALTLGGREHSMNDRMER